MIISEPESLRLAIRLSHSSQTKSDPISRDPLSFPALLVIRYTGADTPWHRIPAQSGVNLVGHPEQVNKNVLISEKNLSLYFSLYFVEMDKFATI